MTLTPLPPAGRQVIISDDNKGPIVNISAWLGMTIMALFVFTRIGSKWAILKRWTLDDLLILITLILACIHTATLSMMVANGLGRHQQTLSDRTITHYQKYGYVSQLFYIPTLCLAKLSTLFYLGTLSPTSTYSTIVKACKALVALWGVGAELAIAFQCSAPSFWSILSTKCFNQIAFWDFIGVMDILTDIAMIFLPAILVWSLQMSQSKKLTVVLAFGTRVLIIPLTILRLYYISTTSSRLIFDQTSAAYHTYLSTTVHLNIAVIVTCLPFLKPFLENMSSGGLAPIVNDLDGSYGTGSKVNTLTSGLHHHKAPKSKGSIRMSSLHRSKIDSSRNASLDGVKVPHAQRQNAPRDRSQFEELGDDDSGSAGLGPLRPEHGGSFNYIGRATSVDIEERSSVGSEKMIITRTTAWDIQEEYEPNREMESGILRENSDGENVDKDWANKGIHYHI
ncbi:hypothetical protein BP6252_14069 [Coleophoma cylindrospora]|uniref:Rhodopsin domain-containing protein n=1 Tax=Coleophoma cylindrospora TaxID=1849047 RepID=A0A3D8Q486_9HELO|nr:hypothetical protein BP6252_14069 [Coleophoma cylindrospora]